MLLLAIRALAFARAENLTQSAQAADEGLWVITRIVNRTRHAQQKISGRVLARLQQFQNARLVSDQAVQTSPFFLVLMWLSTTDVLNANAEVSGLPKQGSDTNLVEARKQLVSIIGTAGVDESRKRYHRPSSSIKVAVAGSLLYDWEHDPIEIGPTKTATKKAAKALSTWELHPIHSITKEQLGAIRGALPTRSSPPQAESGGGLFLATASSLAEITAACSCLQRILVICAEERNKVEAGSVLHFANGYAFGCS